MSEKPEVIVTEHGDGRRDVEVKLTGIGVGAKADLSGGKHVVPEEETIASER